MIDVPTLIIWGKDDTQTPLADGKTFNNLIPNSQLQIIDGGHFIHQEKPNEVASLIL
jgi:pimeloyl-ACP methyl ester carboxylesterase